MGTPDGGQNKKKKRNSPGAAPEEKRTKTGRACDACRTKKIRCDILSSDDDTQPICAHCKQYSIECTFFLPITETRFKKKRLAEAAASPASKPSLNGPDGRTPGGPASILSLVHSQVPTSSFERFDMANHAHWEVSEDADGRIKVEAHAEHPSDADGASAQRLAKYVLPPNMMSALVNSYFDHDSKYLPIIDRAEFLRQRKPYPLLLYAMCAVTATRREFPREVFSRMRGLVNGLLRANEILSHTKIEHIQALLLCCTNGDLNAQPTAPTASAAVLRLSIACRMGQDLKLHREDKSSDSKPLTLEQQEAQQLQRRIWAALMVYDAWYGCALALPVITDVADCDVPIPSPYRVTPDGPVFDESYACLGENLKLATITARILRAMYGPTGMNRNTDADLNGILDDLAAWHDNVPEQLRFKGPESSTLAGMLRMQFTAVQFLFWRCWLRTTHPPPPQITIVLSVSRWQQLVQLSRESIEWLNEHDHTLDTFFVFPYTATSCALVQYHSWARKRDPAILETLKLVHDVVARWEDALQPEQMSTRKKSCETMMLLYEAALKTVPDDDRYERSEGTPGSSVSRGTEGGHAPAFGSRSAAHAQRAQQTRYLERLEGDGPHVVSYDNEANPGAELVTLDEAGDDALLFLDNLPSSNYDWAAW
ncbi:hypothetical protein CC85DRAFT_241990 [Cutaneotrichosporon oleaginosum]|uniref:Zn(2)-C6 fungal-type domain-containing protein n=1 Tax=Cutaneotrichosporon oleaginosum TaxID=879819 RepID=A0A0J0XU75_9TREE|nr:uncharacterized protein CC85DRAFT_241990 [Cutaneotrichosporon oleaginosum]KLT44643.1 hypothetical protein CC85DRAFT_241990 [Cutaneotrichosporon oleaginosum]TXT07630.1 hypothetical protein COLE_04554 [Cutaneotrichosporon oleaginosum]